MNKLGIIGAGTMGEGVAQCFVNYGYNIILVDLDQEKLDNAINKIYNALRFQSLFEKNNKNINPNEAIKNITITTDLKLLSTVDFIIENISENVKLKKELYYKIDSICNENCIFLVDTSCIPITKIASYTNRQEKVIGTHFMNPVPLKKYVEVICGYFTSESTIEATKTLLNSVQKDAIIVGDSPGFVSNRISHVFMNEAAFVVHEKIATPRQVDDIFKNCFGHAMGPLETADLIGIDTVVDSLEVLYQEFQDSKFRCCPLLKKMVSAGLLGKKSGQGFYKY